MPCKMQNFDRMKEFMLENNMACTLSETVRGETVTEFFGVRFYKRFVTISIHSCFISVTLGENSKYPVMLASSRLTDNQIAENAKSVRRAAEDLYLSMMDDVL